MTRPATTHPIELVGLISPYRGSEASETPTPYDPAFVAEIARAYEAAGYDRVLVGQNAKSADSLVDKITRKGVDPSFDAIRAAITDASRPN